MSERLKTSVTIVGPLILLFTTILDPRVSATLAFSALIVLGIWMLLDLNARNKCRRRGMKQIERFKPAWPAVVKRPTIRPT